MWQNAVITLYFTARLLKLPLLGSNSSEKRKIQFKSPQQTVRISCNFSSQTALQLLIDVCLPWLTVYSIDMSLKSYNNGVYIYITILSSYVQVPFLLLVLKTAIALEGIRSLA